MKSSLRFVPLWILTAFLFGCGHVPRDAYIRDGKLLVNTPWGPSELSGGVIATGKAAIEAAIESVRLQNGLGAPALPTPKAPTAPKITPTP